MRARLWGGLALLGTLLAYGVPAAASPAPAATVKVSTVSSGYETGATVTVQGTVTEAGAPLSGVQVALEADGTTSGQTYWVDQVTTAPDGSFTDQFVLPSAAGQETGIKIWAVADGVHGSTTFQVVTPAPPSGGGGAPTMPTCTDQPQGVVLQKPVDSQGGTFTSTDGCITLNVPEGAFSTSTTITVAENTLSPWPDGAETAATPVFAIDFGGAVPKLPIAASIVYSAKSSAGESTARIGLFERNGVYWRYVRDVADAATDTTSANLEEAGSYVVSVNTSTFSDIQQSYWAAAAIDQMLGRDAVSGFPDGTFQPDVAVTRAQFVKMLVLALGLRLPQSATSDGFLDVSPTDWYAPYVDAAVSSKLVLGVTPQEFRPDALITRAQLTVMIARAMNGYVPSQPQTVHFTDQAEIGSWALQDVMQAAQAGIVQGLANGAFNPSGDATRAETAQMVANLVTVTGQ